MMDTQDLEGYTVIGSIGSGGFANVLFGIHNRTGVKVAIKQIPKFSISSDDDPESRIKNEVNLMNQANHPFIASLYEYIETLDYVYLVIEYCQENSLFNYINIHGTIPENDAVKFFVEIMLAIKYLHEDCKIAHRDIKAENILFDENGYIKLIDFGLSSAVNGSQFMKTRCGSPAYASPEIISGVEYNMSCDIWSCGVVLFAMVCGYLPFNDENMNRFAQKIMYQEVSFPAHLSQNLKDLLKKMLTKDFHKRITIKEILNHPWVAQTYSEFTKILENVKIEKEKIFGALENLGFDVQIVKSDISKGIKNIGTVSYKIIQREELKLQMKEISYGFENSYNFIEKKSRRSSHYGEHLPELDYQKHSSDINPRTMPIKHNPNRRRRVLIPIIRLH